MKKGIKVLLIVLAVLVALIGIGLIGAYSGMGYVKTMTGNPVDLSKIADGSYTGTFKQGRVAHSVEVTVRDHRIEAVKTTGTKTPTDPVKAKIFERIVQEQAVNVDTVSGASLTTKAVTKAVENALSGAIRQ